MDRKVLGRGLDALIPKKTAAMLPREFIRLSLDKVKPAKCQPRQEISEKELGELTRSIKEKGFIQPIVAREISGGSYEIVAGERRYEAAKSLGLKEIPTIIKELDDKEAFILAIVENLQRQDLNPIEEAQAFKRLIEEFEFSLEDTAKFVGKDKSTVVNTLRLLKLPDKINRLYAKVCLLGLRPGQFRGGDFSSPRKVISPDFKRGPFSQGDRKRRARLISKKRKKTDPLLLKWRRGCKNYWAPKLKSSIKGIIVVELSSSIIA